MKYSKRRRLYKRLSTPALPRPPIFTRINKFIRWDEKKKNIYYLFYLYYILYILRDFFIKVRTGIKNLCITFKGVSITFKGICITFKGIFEKQIFIPVYTY